MSVKDTKKLVNLQERITESIEKGTLTADMDILALEAAELEIDKDELQVLIDEVKNQKEKAEKATATVSNYKSYILAAMIIVVLLECFLPFGWITKIIVMIISIAAIVLVSSVLLAKKK